MAVTIKNKITGVTRVWRKVWPCPDIGEKMVCALEDTYQPGLEESTFIGEIEGDNGIFNIFLLPEEWEIIN